MGIPATYTHEPISMSMPMASAEVHPIGLLIKKICVHR